MSGEVTKNEKTPLGEKHKEKVPSGGKPKGNKKEKVSTEKKHNKKGEES
jgi:hypothetical protein